ncbi:MAG: hypothetical protein KC609_08060 [Myxococcales bacterium]|nr:hypothetical protein [Myxococcales bacterium]
MLGTLLQWLHGLADTDPTLAGAQPSWLYVVLSVLVPASIGVLVALSLIGAERLWRRLR